jgi:hypothetical protein
MRLPSILLTGSFLRILFLGLLPVASSAMAKDIGGHRSVRSLETLKLSIDLGIQDPPLPLVSDAFAVLFTLDNEPESPLSQALSLVDGKDRDPSRIHRAKHKLWSHLNNPGTKLVLLNGRVDGQGYLPERAESLETNWIFSLIIPTLSDHIFWIVIPKDPDLSGKGYAYGFN